VVSFSGTNGSVPSAGLIEGKDGRFYGAAQQGGADGRGTVFQLTRNGDLRTLVAFNGTNGARPWAAPLEAEDGTLYGTTSEGTTYPLGANDYGTIFRIVIPSLSITQSGNNLIISWSTNLKGFSFQSATVPNTPVNWIDSTNQPAVLAGRYVATNAISDQAQFYRLRKP
jgi:uncharacterized repeat protein (TIGR03803 family)